MSNDSLFVLGLKALFGICTLVAMVILLWNNEFGKALAVFIVGNVIASIWG